MKAMKRCFAILYKLYIDRRYIMIAYGIFRRQLLYWGCRHGLHRIDRILIAVRSQPHLLSVKLVTHVHTVAA